MKKKFSSLFMVATLVFAVGALFSSCRDHDEELVAELDAQAQVIEELNQDLSDAVADLKGEIDEALPEVEADIEGLEGRIDDLEALIDSLAGLDHTVCNHVCDTCNHVCDTCDHVCDTCDLSGLATKQELADSLAALHSAIQALADKMATKDALKEVADSLAALKGDYNSHIEKFNELSATVTEALGRLSTLEGQFVTLDASVKTIQTDIIKIQGDLATVMVTAAEADQRSKENEAKIAIIDGEIDDLKAYVDSLVGAKATELTAALQDSVAALRAEYTEALADSIAELRAEAAANLAEAKAYADKAAAAVAEELAKTNATVEELQKAFKKAVAELQDQIDVLQEEVDELAEELREADENLSDRIDSLENKIDEVEGKVDDLEEKIQNAISSIVLNGAYSPVVGYFSLPTGVKSNILAAYYGEANDFHFPTTRTVYNVAGSGAFTDEDFAILGIQETAQPGGVIVADGNNAGKLYVTFNPAEVSLDGKEFAFVNSLGEESPVKIDVDNVKKTEDKLTFGYTRAGAVALYEMPAKLAAEDVEAAKLRIELSDLKDLIKDVATISDGFNVSDMATTLYAVVNDVADAQALKATWTDAFGAEHTVYSDFGLATVAVKPLGYNFLADLEVSSLPGYNRVMNVVNKIFDRVDNISIPDFGLSNLTLPEIKKIEIAELSDDLLAKFKITISETVEYDLDIVVPVGDVVVPGKDITVPGATVEVPAQTVTVPAREIDITLADGTVTKATIPAQTVTIDAQTVTIDGKTVWVDGETIHIDDVKYRKLIEFPVNISYDMTDAVKELYGDMTGSIEDVNEMLGDFEKFLDQVNDMLADVNGKIESVEDALHSAADKVQKNLNKYLDKINKKLCSMINSFNAVLQPTMLVSTVDGFSMLSSIKSAPTTIDKASAVLVPTSFSGEFLAPASKKYIAVTKAYDAEGNVDNAAAVAANTGDLNKVLEGGVREVAFDGKSGYTYEITYSAVDFYGMISTNKYYVKVK